MPISVPNRTGRTPGAIRSPCRPRWALGRPRGGHPAPAGPLPLATALLQPAGRPCRASAPPQRSMPPQRLSGARSTPAAPEAAHNRLAGENRGHPRHPQTTATAPDRPKPRWDASDGPRTPLDAMAGHLTPIRQTRSHRAPHRAAAAARSSFATDPVRPDTRTNHPTATNHRHDKRWELEAGQEPGPRQQPRYRGRCLVRYRRRYRSCCRVCYRL